MRKILVCLALSAVLLLSACGLFGERDAIAEAGPEFGAEPQSGAAPAQAGEGFAHCTVVSQEGLAPTAELPFPPPSEADWSTGPADAKMTLVEYGDFQ